MNAVWLRRLVQAVARKPTAGRLRGLGALCILVALAGWAVASPVGASPDEDYHLISIWCSHGERAGLCEPGETPELRRVPSQFQLDVICYRFDPDQSAACQPDLSTAGELVSSDRGNFTGDYPPVYYWVAGLFAGDAISASVLTMRMVNATIYVALVVALYLLVSPGLRRALVTGALVTAVPLGMFLIPSINPSGWAMLAATTFFVSLLGYLTTNERRRRIWLGALAAFSLLIGAGARADAAIYAVVAVVAAVVLVWRRGSGHLVRFALPGVLAVAAVAAFLTTGQAESADPEGSAQPFSIGRLVRTAIDVPALWIGAMGSPPPKRDFGEGWPWGLGWLDTPMPGAVWVGMWGVYAAVLFVAVTGADRRRIVATAAVATAAAVIPVYMMFLTGSLVGGPIQPRYVLPLLTLLAITAMVRLDGTAFRLTRGQRWITVAVLTVANTMALYANLRRYVTGNGSPSWNLDTTAEWWWSLPVSPLTVLAVTAVAFGAGVVLLTAELTTQASATDGPVDAETTEPAEPIGRHARRDTPPRH